MNELLIKPLQVLSTGGCLFAEQRLFKWECLETRASHWSRPLSTTANEYLTVLWAKPTSYTCQNARTYHVALWCLSYWHVKTFSCQLFQALSFIFFFFFLLSTVLLKMWVPRFHHATCSMQQNLRLCSLFCIMCATVKMVVEVVSLLTLSSLTMTPTLKWKKKANPIPVSSKLYKM